MVKKCSSDQSVPLLTFFFGGGEIEPCYLAQACLELKLLLSDACVRVHVFIQMFSLLLSIVTVCACVMHIYIW